MMVLERTNLTKDMSENENLKKDNSEKEISVKGGKFQTCFLKKDNSEQE